MFDDYSPVWRFVGKYIRFSQNAEDIAMGLVRQAFGLRTEEKLEPVSNEHKFLLSMKTKITSSTYLYMYEEATSSDSVPPTGDVYQNYHLMRDV